jgi:hypothetical protein
VRVLVADPRLSSRQSGQLRKAATWNGGHHNAVHKNVLCLQVLHAAVPSAPWTHIQKCRRQFSCRTFPSAQMLSAGGRGHAKTSIKPTLLYLLESASASCPSNICTARLLLNSSPQHFKRTHPHHCSHASGAQQSTAPEVPTIIDVFQQRVSPACMYPRAFSHNRRLSSSFPGAAGGEASAVDVCR